MNALLNWLDDRTGYRALAHEALYERIPGGSRWRYVWGSTLVFAFVTQLITGLFLWMSYSPSAQTAWESVYFIQHDVQGGWLLRGLHHFMAQAMVVLLALHLMQVLIDGAYRAPRELNFWVGLVLLQIVLGLSLTGYLLPWDQKGYWATKVATNLAGVVPLIGPMLQRLAVGGAAYGHQTLTRFFALHAGLLPGLLILFLAVHIYVFRRHGIHANNPAEADATFWPDQVLKDAIACLAVLAVVMFLVLWNHGADLGAPADPADPYSAARPEWYFLFLFQFLKYFHGETEVYGAIVIPGLVFLVLALMPLVGRWKLGHRFNIAFGLALLVGILFLTAMAIRADRNNAEYQVAVTEAEENAARAIALAQGTGGIPASGALTLMRTDPATMGPRLFRQNCASCHFYSASEGAISFTPKEPHGSDLAGFATRAWLAGLLNPEKIATAHYFGNTAHKEGEMVNWVKENVPGIDKGDLEKAIAALSAQARLPQQREDDAKDATKIEQGVELIKNKLGCIDCHRFQDAGEAGSAPDLTDYGTQEWLVEFIKNPGGDSFYGEHHQMPAFEHQRSEADLHLIAAWLRGEGHQSPVTVAARPAQTEKPPKP